MVQSTKVKYDKPKKIAFNGLTAKEWAMSSKSVWTARDVSSQREKHHIEHGATFPVALAENAIKRYSAKNDLILDPFLGVADTLIACRNMDRNGIGFEIYKKYFDISKRILKQNGFGDNYQKPIHDDFRKKLNKYVKNDHGKLTVHPNTTNDRSF